MNTDLFLGFLISLITNLHQGQRACITFIGAGIAGAGRGGSGSGQKWEHKEERNVILSLDIKILSDCTCFLLCYWE